MARTGTASSEPVDRPPLGLDAIVAEALRIIDAEGCDAVSMRRVASHFGTGPASLYAYVDNREELMLLANDAVLGAIALPRVDRRRWRPQLLRLLTEMRDVLVAHNDLAMMSIGRIPYHPHGLKVADRMMALLKLSGMSDRDVALAADLLPLYVVAVAYEDGVERLQGLGKEQHAVVAETWARLPAADYPTLASLVHALFTAGDDEVRFRFGLEVLLDGLVARTSR